MWIKFNLATNSLKIFSVCSNLADNTQFDKRDAVF